MTMNRSSKPSNSKPKRKRSKVSEGIIIALIGAIATIIVAILSILKETYSPMSATFTSTYIYTSTDVMTTSMPATTSIPNITPTQKNNQDFTYLMDEKGIEMAHIPSGKFIMGGSQFDDEQPIHIVFLDAYYIDKYEVTNSAYKVCVDSGVCDPPANTASLTHGYYFGNPQFANYPIISMTWYQAKTFCAWRGGNLPTEAQWEKAARGTEGNIYPWGDEFNGNYANFCDKNCPYPGGNMDYDDGNIENAPVGSYPLGVSPYGVYDMEGNVMEWTADWYDSNYYSTLVDGVKNPLGPLNGTDRVLRGGGWDDPEFNLQTAKRFPLVPTANDNTIVGFRCARVLIP